MVRRVTRLLGALSFGVPTSLAAAASATTLTEEIPTLKLELPASVNINVLLPLKAGLIGVMAAALLAFWGFFWTEVIAPSVTREDLPSIVKSYRRSFAYFVPALLLLFVSIGADFYLLLVNGKSVNAGAISFGTFGAAMFMLLLFIIAFSVRTLVEMNDLLKAGKLRLDASTGSIVEEGNQPT